MATFTASAAQANIPAIMHLDGTITRVVQRTVAVALSAGDVYQMVKVPTGAVIGCVTVATDLFGGGNATMTVGDGNDADRYITSASTSSSAVLRLSNPVGFGYSYSAEDTIDITFSTVTSASAVGSVTLIVEYTMQNG